MINNKMKTETRKRLEYTQSMKRLSKYLERNIDHFYFEARDGWNTKIYSMETGEKLAKVHKTDAVEINKALETLKNYVKFIENSKRN